ncbi:cytochrome-c peroxidase [Lacinutrix jangbogonensis]|uniref:cytochrome-c peroxidase n=1 Tax=Lacinutrix jangbogonensis TaxID=1469557 RepID=UPI00053D2875|nr:cytochrome c peroxidase [Lacinutrix jangbogonensis]
MLHNCLYKILSFILILIIFSCENESSYEDISTIDSELLSLIDNNSMGIGSGYFLLPSANDYAAIPQDPLNPITTAKVTLGKMLVHDTATGGNPKMDSETGAYSCASCHPMASSFYSGNTQGIGEGGFGYGNQGETRIPNLNMPLDSVDILPIKVPTLLNVAYQKVMLWNGALGGTDINTPYTNLHLETIPENVLGYEGLEVQGMNGQTAHRLKIDLDFVNTHGYKAMFDQAFPDIDENERYSKLTGGLAIAAYNRTLLSNEAPWQYWLSGDYNAMSIEEKRGAILFFDKANCVSCHTGPALKSNAFYALGLNDMNATNNIVINEDQLNTMRKGRGGFTNNPEDNFKFKVPTIYNLKGNSVYGHGGSFTTLKNIISYIASGQKENELVPNTQLAQSFIDVDLTQQEILDLTSFVENALYDANLERYVPESVFSGNCIPNGDSQSQIDLGCN